RPERPTLFPYTTLFRSVADVVALHARVEMRIAGEIGIGFAGGLDVRRVVRAETPALVAEGLVGRLARRRRHRQPRNGLRRGRIADRKSTRLNSSHLGIS